jgi:plastocyanin
MAERPVVVGFIPQAVVVDPGDHVSWFSDAGNLKLEFDANRCPFASNIFQAPEGIRLLSGPVTPGTKAGSYKYRLFLNEQMIGRGEVIVRDK